MNRKGGSNFTAYSAGSHPTGAVRPEAINQIEKTGLSAANARSKCWDEFSTAEAPHLSFVFTVCDNAATEVCPLWPGQPMTAHWGIPDPAAVQGTAEEIERACIQAFAALETPRGHTMHKVIFLLAFTMQIAPRWRQLSSTNLSDEGRGRN